MKRHLAYLAFAIGTAAAGQAMAQVGTPIFQENFNGVTLGNSVNVRTANVPTTRVLVRADTPGTAALPNAFTHTPPAGWVVHPNFDNFGNHDLTNLDHAPTDIVGNFGIGSQGSPDSGVDEWEGWSFAASDFWVTANGADTQRRGEFVDGLANHSKVAVADNDEYDDFGLGDDGLYYNTGMSTGSISVVGKSNVHFTLDSSWRPEAFDEEGHKLLGNAKVNNQTAIIYASFDGADPVIIKTWNSDSSDPNFKGDSPNETIEPVPVNVPGGAQNMKLSFAYINAQNDWWWAIDNLKLHTGTDPGTGVFWSEDFESVTLHESANERLSNVVFKSSFEPDTSPIPNAFTHTGPANWSTNNDSLGVGFNDDDFGLFEWEGWTYSTKEFNATSSGSRQLQDFTKSTGSFAIADSDAYSTGAGGLGNGFSGTDAEMTAGFVGTILQTPQISLTGLAANTLKMQFDSAWRDNASAQSAELTVQYGNGPEITVLNWTSDAVAPDPKFHDTNLNETVLLSLNNPAGATTAVFRFKYEGTDDWFWAIDNILIGTGGAAVDTDSDGDRDGADFLALQRNAGQGIAAWKAAFGSGPVSAVPEPSAVALLTIGAALIAWRRRGGKA